MNVIATAKNILCYGDSNTWGQTPDKTGNRYAADVRWTGVLQAAIGDEYYVIEEGLSSRTTNLDYAKKPGRNGLVYLEPCLDSHAPLDAVILMLGTNDFKIEFDRSAEEIAHAISGLVELIVAKTQRYGGVPARVVLVSPILVDENAPRIKEWYSGHYDDASAQKSRELAAHLEEVSRALRCIFVDAAQVSKAGDDGIHFDRKSHKALGNLLAQQLKNLR